VQLDLFRVPVPPCGRSTSRYCELERGSAVDKTRRSKDRADIFAKTGIIPVIAAAFETYPELDVPEVLALCVPALAENLREEFYDVRRNLIEEIRRRLRLRAGAPSPENQRKTP
jgi:hypothetical protein